LLERACGATDRRGLIWIEAAEYACVRSGRSATDPRPRADEAIRSTIALDRLDLAVRMGEVYGYLGPNGAGKTTTIRLLLGLHRPSAGGASLFGVDAWRDPIAAHRRIAYVAGGALSLAGSYE
jgi:ABC-type multidrug transport system ATPase subunit